jgi:transcriptional regulator with XRE-family HTH domain
MRIFKKYLRFDYRLGRQIQKERKEVGLTQAELAGELKISHTYLGNVEIGRKRPNLIMLYRIAEKLRIKVKDLFPF